MSFNSKLFPWSSASILILGKTVTGIRGFKYSVESDDEYVYGKGSEPYEIMPGNKSYPCELMLLQDEIEALEIASKLAGGADITDIRFDVVVSYTNPGSLVATTDVWKSIKIDKYEKGMKQGDKFMEITLPGKALGVIRNKQ